MIMRQGRNNRNKKLKLNLEQTTTKIIKIRKAFSMPSKITLQIKVFRFLSLSKNIVRLRLQCKLIIITV